jgi:carotenoid cleavage dioxygenase-like enzyme
MADTCKKGQAPMDMMFFNEEKPGYFKIFDKRNMKWFSKTFESDAFMQVHMIQAYVDAEKNKIIFDTCETPKGDIYIGM